MAGNAKAQPAAHNSRANTPAAADTGEQAPEYQKMGIAACNRHPKILNLVIEFPHNPYFNYHAYPYDKGPYPFIGDQPGHERSDNMWLYPRYCQINDEGWLLVHDNAWIDGDVNHVNPADQVGPAFNFFVKTSQLKKMGAVLYRGIIPGGKHIYDATMKRYGPPGPEGGHPGGSYLNVPGIPESFIGSFWRKLTPKYAEREWGLKKVKDQNIDHFIRDQ
jgi:hypothetical protein